MMGAGNVEHAAEFLVGTTYEPARRRAEGHPTPVLEREMWQEVFGTWTRLVKFLEGPQAEPATAYVRQFEIENIRRVVRRVLADVSPSLATPLWNIGPLAAIKGDDLARTHTLLGVHEILARTPYSRIFDLAEHRLVEGEPLFAFEQVLDAGYLDMLLVAARTVRGAHGRSARAYVEPRIHYTNVRWALRLRFGRHLPSDQVRQFLVREDAPAYRKDIDGIVEAENLADATRSLGRVLGRRGVTFATLRECDKALRADMARWSRRELRASFFEFASLFAYFDVRVQEVRDIATILSGLRQGRTEDEIRSHLGLVA
jgi:vacuolar-type H+-ATPase subunit C/Vma6